MVRSGEHIKDKEEIKTKRKKKLLSYCCKAKCYTEHANSLQHKCSDCDERCISYNMIYEPYRRYTCNKNNPAYELIQKSDVKAPKSGLFDHCRTGWDRTGRPFVEGNPYGITGSDLAHFVELARDLGYIFTIDKPPSNYRDSANRVCFSKVDVGDSKYHSFYQHTSQATGLLIDNMEVSGPQCKLCGLRLDPTKQNKKYCDRAWCGIPELFLAWYDFECARCSNDLTLDVHHLDKNRGNNQKTDFLELCKRFIVLCPTCHYGHHRNELDKEELLRYHKPLPEIKRKRKEKLAEYAKKNFGDSSGS